MGHELRDGIMGLNTRQFGRVVELLIKIIKKQKDSRDLSYDLLDGNNKIEVKASRVYKKNTLKLKEENLYELIINNSNKNRLVKQSEIEKYDFDCNIQQIKTNHFDILYYVLFFFDLVEIFKITSDKIKKDKNIFYSNKQHRGNEGEGQFHINNKTYQHHKENYFNCFFTYEAIKIRLKAQ